MTIDFLERIISLESKIGRRYEIGELETVSTLIHERIDTCEAAFKELQKRVSLNEKQLNFVPTFESLNNLDNELYKIIKENEEKLNLLNSLIRTIEINYLSKTHADLMVEQNMNIIHEKIDALGTEINTVRTLGSRAFHPKKPYKCPVCDGNGGFLSTEPNECHACEGKGIVWS